MELLSISGSVNQLDYNGKCPLEYAVKKGRIDIVMALLRIDASVTQLSGPLHLAVFDDRIDIVVALLKNGALVNRSDIEGHFPLCIASELGHLDVVDALLSNGASINQPGIDGVCPLQRAAMCGYLDVVERLLKNGAEVNRRDKYGLSPLMTVTSLIKVGGNAFEVARLHIIAFELVKNKASMTKLDVAILSKCAVYAASRGIFWDNSFLQILWESAELRNSKNIEELRNFNVTDLDMKNSHRDDFSAKDEKDLDNKFKGLSSKVKMRYNSELAGSDWNWHHIVLNCSYDSNTNQAMTALFVDEKNEKNDNKLPVWSRILNGFSKLTGNFTDVQNVTNQETLEDQQRFQYVYAELISQLDKDLQSESWARMYQQSVTVVDDNDEAEKDLMIQSAMIARLTAKGSVQGEDEEEIMEDRDLEVDYDRYVTMEEQIITPQSRVETVEFTLDTLKWRNRADERFIFISP
jgi:hypothetical protein